MAGCHSNPLKCLPEHLSYAHPDLSAERRAEFAKKALVFHLPEGHRKMQAVVKRGGRLQLAKKSTAGFSERMRVKRRRKDVERHSDVVISSVEATRTSARRTVYPLYTEFTSSSSEDEESVAARQVRYSDKATQCNLLPAALLDRMAQAAREKPITSAPDTNTSHPVGTFRPQYAKKSTCGSPSSATTVGVGTSQGDPGREELVVRRRSSFTLMKKKVQFPRRSPSPSCSCEDTGGGGELEREEEQLSSVVLSPLDQDCEGSNPSTPNPGEPCELMCKWGDWDVIFFETPHFHCASKPHQHSVVVNLN